jgi:fumarate reductase subunit D
MKRSNQPPLWVLFGAGGVLSALFAPALVYLTGFDHALGYDDVQAFARHLIGKAFLFAVVALFLWHAAHRIFHTLHDFGIRTGVVAWIACYGVALAGSLVAAASLIAV